MKDAIYIATAIPYANGVPHVGHAMESIYSDALNRYYRTEGRNSAMSIGMDEHGQKIFEAAEKAKIEVREFASQNSERFTDLYNKLRVDYDYFVRTSNPEHKKRAQVIWQNLERYIYKGSYKGMYDVKEEEYVTDEEARQIEKDDPARYATFRELEEDNYFFRLSEFTDQIKEAINSGQMQVIPKSRQNEIMSVLEDGLQDISISRSAEKLSWGIPVPGDDSQTMYVWFEALMNYITALGYPDGADMQKFWPADVQVLGKDIIRFHAAIWPAMLIGLGLELPKKVYVHGMVTMNGKKMSKSIGNVVDPQKVIDLYGSDAMRYFFLRHIPSHGDGDFTWKKLHDAYGGELANELGNLVQRLTTLTTKNMDGQLGDLLPPMHDEGRYHTYMDELRFDKALDEVWKLIKSINQYLEQEKPWSLAKKPDEKEHVAEILTYAVSSLMQVAKLAYPFIPTTAEAIKYVFDSGTVQPLDTVLFPRIEETAFLEER